MASQAADQWVNSGWQLQKRAGQPLPEIRPNAASVAGKANAWLPAEGGEAAAAGGSAASPPLAPLSLARKAPELGLAGPSGSLAQVDQQASALLAPTQGSLELQKEFCSFLAPQEGRAYRTNEAGEVIFASRDALAALVVEFSYAKLRELAAAARALARYVDDLEGHLVPSERAHTSAHHGAPASHRYVDDLEGELEAADDAVVSLRRQVTSEKTKLSELERTNTELKARADVYASELAGAQASLDDNGAKLAAAEQAAERAAAQLLETQRQAVQAAEATDDEQRQRAVTRLTKLMKLTELEIGS